MEMVLGSILGLMIAGVTILLIKSMFDEDNE